MSLCPCCDGGGARFKSVNGYAIHKCLDCELEYCFDMPSEETLAKFYSHYSDHLMSEPVAKLNALKNAADLRFIPGITVLDFGCGEGHFAKSLLHNQARAIASEDRYRDGEKVKGKFNYITMWGVLEHLTDPFDELCGLYQRLEDKGRIALTTVSIETPIPYRHKPPEHTLYFTRAAIAALADRCGFRVIEYRPYRMMQDSDVYLDTLLRTMPDEYQAAVTHSMPKYVEIPTNEVFVVMEKV